jgi:hypothetical protein
MRKVILVGAVLILLGLVIAFYPSYVEPPVKNGAGPLAIRLDPGLTAPQTPTPLDWWQTHHMDVLNQGDLSQADCLYCHDPQTSCDNCHSYVGVMPIAGSKWQPAILASQPAGGQ